MKLQDYRPSLARKICVYGEPKTGKTELVGALTALDYRLWWFDLDNGIKTLLRPDSSAAKNLDKIEFFSIPDTQEFPIGVETLLKVAKGGKLRICHKHGKVGCLNCTKSDPSAFSDIDTSGFTNKDVLVIDSVSQLSASVMNHIKRDDIAKGKEDIKPDWDDYAKQGFVMDRIMSTFQQAKYHVVMISHAQMVELDDKKKRLVPIGGTSNFSKTFAKYFDDVVYTEFVNGKYRAYSDATQNSMAIIGSRTGKRLIEGEGLKALFTD